MTGADYRAANAYHRRAKAALTRAINSNDPDRVIKACREAVTKWNREGWYWPDDWSRWQRALDDVLGWQSSLRLEDLEV